MLPLDFFVLSKIVLSPSGSMRMLFSFNFYMDKLLHLFSFFRLKERKGEN